MKSMGEGLDIDTDDKKDFTIDDLAVLKEDLLNLEKAVDAIKVPNAQGGLTLEGSYIFTLMEEANVKLASYLCVYSFVDVDVYIITDNVWKFSCENGTIGQSCLISYEHIR